jgi:hypothetical protein
MTSKNKGALTDERNHRRVIAGWLFSRHCDVHGMGHGEAVMLRTLSSVIRSAFFIVSIAITVTYLLANRIAVYRLTTEVALLHAKFNAYLITEEQRDLSVRDELTTLEKTIYSPPTEAKDTVRKPAAVEQWMVNSDNELRKRIIALEQWRLKQEAK